MSSRRFPALMLALAPLAFQKARTEPQSHRFRDAVHAMETRGDYETAIRLFLEVSEGPDLALAAEALLYLGMCYEKRDPDQARGTYLRLLRDYPDDRDVIERARERLVRLSPSDGVDGAHQMVARRLVEEDSLDVYHCAPLPQGGGLVTVDWSTGDVALFDLDTRETRRISGHGSHLDYIDFATHPVVSPDGKQVAYAWRLGEEERVELRVIDVDGSNEQTIWNGTFFRPDGWSGDHRYVYGISKSSGSTYEIALVPVVDGSPRILKTLESEPLETSLSPDGRYVVYDLPQDDGSEARDLFILGVDGSGENRVVRHPGNDVWPAWTPDGGAVLFYSDRAGVFGLWLLSLVDGSVPAPPVQVKKEMGPASPIGFSSDGSYYYALVAGNSNVYIASIDRATSEIKAPRLHDIGYSGFNLMPDWSPDGECLAHITMRKDLHVLPTSHRLAVSCYDDGEMRLARELVPELEYIRVVKWSPDGKFILSKGNDRNQRWGIYRIDAAGGAIDSVVQDEPGAFTVSEPEWTRDSRGIFYKRDFPGKPRRVALIQRDLVSGLEKELYRVEEPGSLGGYNLSPDGETLAMTTRDEEHFYFRLLDLTAPGTPPKEIFRSSTGIGRPFWTPDGKEFWFARGSSPDLGEPNEVWRLSLETGEVARTELVMPGLRNLSLHPDGERLAFISGWLTARTELWVIENFLPPPSRR